MITQTAPDGEPHFVLTMADHNAMCGQMARAFGNDRFEAPAPFAEVVYVVENHDRGWAHYDANPGLDPSTRLPYIMARTPLRDALKTSTGSPEFNEGHHAYCGLLSSLHSCGLYNGRYGFSRFAVRPQSAAADHERIAIDAMLADEAIRQARLKATLAASPTTLAWIEERRLFQSYKQLQFFDTLSLYFHLRHAGARGEETYVHVPRDADTDATITLSKQDDHVYRLDPFPFTGDRLTLTCAGRYAMPFAADFPPDRVGAALAELPADEQTYELVPAR
jgi:hypothetical protein